MGAPVETPPPPARGQDLGGFAAGDARPHCGSGAGGYRSIRRSLALIRRVGTPPLRKIAEFSVFATMRLWLKAYEVPADQRTREYRELFRIIAGQTRRDGAQGAG